MRTFKKKFVPMQSTAVELTIGKNKIKVQFDKLKRVCSVKKILEDESLETIPTLSDSLRKHLVLHQINIAINVLSDTALE